MTLIFCAYRILYGMVIYSHYHQAQSEVEGFIEAASIQRPVTTGSSSHKATVPTPLNNNVSVRAKGRGSTGRETQRSRSSTGMRKSISSRGQHFKPKPAPDFNAQHAKHFSKQKSITNIVPRVILSLPYYSKYSFMPTSE